MDGKKDQREHGEKHEEKPETSGRLIVLWAHVNTSNLLFAFSITSEQGS